MIAGRLVEDARPVLDAAALWVVGGEIEPADAGERDRGGAHRARLQRDVEIAIGEPFDAQPGGTGAQYQHLGVRGRIMITLDPVAGGGNDRAGGIG